MLKLRRSAVLLVSLGVLAAACSDDSKSSTATSEVAVTDSGAPSTEAPTTEAPTTEVLTPALAHVRGTAYTFNTPDPIAGATIKVEEVPEASAVTAADGSYELELPYGATVTPYIEAAGHHGIHTQTFVLDEAHDGTELDGVNFQTPSDTIYDALVALVGGFVGHDPFGDGCVFVTTVGDARMVGMTFDEFINFHPHGVAGATVSIDPAVSQPIYFNDNVLPDQAQTVSSGDGGVLFTNVPPGEYTLSATMPGMEFVTVHATCEAGWVVNANPVWGLHAIP